MGAMQHSLLFVSLLFSAAQIATANVYSCEEMRTPFWDTAISHPNTACVVTQEGFSNYDVLTKLSIFYDRANSINFTDLAKGPSHCADKPSNLNWEILHAGYDPIDCSQEFTLILEKSYDLKGTNVFVVPQTGMYIRTESCRGKGNVTVSTGAGRGEDENRFVYRSWPCSSVPDWILSYDNVITINADEDVVYSIRISSDTGVNNKITVSPGSKIVVFSSGRSDNLQNLQGTNHGTNFALTNGQFSGVTVNMYLTFDSSNNGVFSLFKSADSTSVGYYNGTHSEKFTTNYFGVRYFPKGLKPNEIFCNNDNIIVEISIDAQNGYCNCDVDKFGFPLGWQPSDLWLDIIILLDTSEAMGDEELNDAGALIESFLSDGTNAVLSTDSYAKFYTRVGVISVSDSAKTLYNLNMSKNDKIQGKVSIKKGVKEMNYTAAYESAQNMFKSYMKSDRSNTRQLIYYMTASNPNGDSTPLDDFKSSRGIVIVNDLVKYGGVEISSLTEFASDGYYFSNSNYMQGLQAFCEANCFCKSIENVPYGEFDHESKATGGCYHPSFSGVSFSKAKGTCAIEGGIVATIHNDEKGRFLAELMKSSKSDYYWIGYNKTDSGAWQWEDKSTDSYKNWGVNEPSSASVAKCAYVDTTETTLPWGAGNCQIGFPYVCQYAMCTVGNKNC